MTKNIEEYKLVNGAVEAILEKKLSERKSGNAVFGYFQDVPSTAILDLVEKFDYTGHILLSELAQNDLICNYDDDFSSREGIASTGGYAIDSIPSEFGIFKQFFNLLSLTSGTVEFTKNFIIFAQVTEKTITPISASTVFVESDESSSRVLGNSINPDFALSIFTTAARTAENGRDYQRDL